MMDKLKPESFKPLDKEEKKLMDSLDNETVAKIEQRKEEAKTAARNTIRKNKL